MTVAEIKATLQEQKAKVIEEQAKKHRAERTELEKKIDDTKKKQWVRYDLLLFKAEQQFLFKF